MTSNRDKIVQEFRHSICKVSQYMNCTSLKLLSPAYQEQWSPRELIAYLTSKDCFVLKKRIPYMMKRIDFPDCSNFIGFQKFMMNGSEPRKVQEVCREFILIRKMLIHQIQHISESEWVSKISLETFEFTFQDYFEYMIEQEKPYFTAIDELLFEKNEK